MLEDKIQQDLKTALLGGNKPEAETLRGLKSALLNAKIEQGKRDDGLDDAAVITILQKEAKKRQESADLYTQGGNSERAAAELAEKQLIERYLPAQLSEAELRQLVDEAVQATGAQDAKAMGQVIAAVKQKTAGAADGATIARLVRERLSA